MNDPRERIARAIAAFVENPVTNLVKGLALFSIGAIDASRTFREDVANGRVRVGHGLVIIGFFSILGALPHLNRGAGGEQEIPGEPGEGGAGRTRCGRAVSRTTSRPSRTIRTARRSCPHPGRTPEELG